VYKKKQVVGGGLKKILYALEAVRKIGPVKASKALRANNTCKACGLGMGGQKGGMTNELGEFPAVCNKSVQAQTSDIQPAIPNEIFNHCLDDFRELSGRELDRLGRLDTPLWKASGAEKYSPISWDSAYEKATAAFNEAQPQRSFFYSSGRSSNEAAFIFQLLARLYGTNNVSNCSYYCHQATSEALSTTIGTGTSTIELQDLDGADIIFVIGANPASNHPRFIHKLKACRDRGGHVVVINPAKEPGLVKFAIPKSPSSLLKGGDEIASHYLQPRVGSDVAVMMALAKAVLANGKEAREFINDHTISFEEFKASIDAVTWQEIEELTGVERKYIEEVANVYCHCENAVFAWGMGLTHHLNGVENVEAVANLALVRGMVGRKYAGLLPLRGHSNVQGIGTIGVKPVLADTVFKAMEQEFNVKLPSTKGLDTLSSLKAASEGEVDLALIMGGNLFAATPNTSFSQQALNNIPSKIFLTTSLNSGHVNGVDGDVLILPVAARDEEWNATTQESMFNFVRLSDGGIVRHKNVRPESVVLTDIAINILGDLPFDIEIFKDHKNVREAIANIVPGMAELKDIDVALQEFHIQGRILHTPEFKTANGKACFTPCSLPFRAKSQKGLPFNLSTIRSEGQFNSIIYEERDTYRGVDERWSVLMNKHDISDLGLTAGDKIDILSQQGQMKGVKVFAFDVPRGNMLAYYPEANQLTGLDFDPRSKTPAFKNVPVKIEKLH
jgi:molybdopterin-dependent oxidoreductase alpha subunit